jgi:PIN domain nuclease of toxin-antitoxin system
MKYLLDTHTLIWFVNENTKLPQKVRDLIEFSDNCFISPINKWEIAIKKSIGKLNLENSMIKLFELINSKNFNIVDISEIHSIKVSELPFHHRDPFDRMLISQAITEDMTIITRDEKFKMYDVQIL